MVLPDVTEDDILLLETEIELNWTPVPVSKFDSVNMSANDLLKIAFLFSE
jgi:hypothetical protein